VIDRLRAALCNDLDTPTALRVIDDALAQGVDDSRLIGQAIDALLGVRV
jgi:L-cysteine:1D-myo-inositol 2-amino-2-deoxy-alpha-D-glucopyranoside ligase